MSKLLSIFILSLTLGGCGEYLWPRDEYITYTSSDWLFDIRVSDSAIEQDINKNDIDKFVSKIDPYLKKVMPLLQAEGLLNDELFVPQNDYLARLTVHIGTDYNFRGIFMHGNLIILNREDKMLSVFGHELVRYLLYMSGEKQLAYSSSLDWSGDIGLLWNIAETTSLEFL